MWEQCMSQNEGRTIIATNELKYEWKMKPEVYDNLNQQIDGVAQFKLY